MAKLQFLTKEELKIGMHVRFEQLFDVYETWVYYLPTDEEGNEGDILYFTEEQDDPRGRELCDQYENIAIIYQALEYEPYLA